MIVAWSDFSWEAFATLVTGTLAVGGAVMVGLRQAKIAARQSEILAEQSAQQFRLGLQNTQISLLQRRSDCINRARELVGEWFTHGRIKPEQWTPMRELLWEAQLLFPEDIVTDIDSILLNVMKANRHSIRAESYHESNNEEKAQGQLEKAFDCEDAIHEAIEKIVPRMVKVAKIDAALILSPPH